MDNTEYNRTVKIGGVEYPIRKTTEAIIRFKKLTEARNLDALTDSERLEMILEMAKIYINCAIAAQNMEARINDKTVPVRDLITTEHLTLLCSDEELVDILNVMKDLRDGMRKIKTEGEDAPKKANAE